MRAAVTAQPGSENGLDSALRVLATWRYGYKRQEGGEEKGLAL